MITPDVRVLPVPLEGHRVETGVTRFGDDWPGVFIRGDAAFFYAMQLASVLESLDASHDPIERSALQSLLELLQSSRVSHNKE